MTSTATRSDLGFIDRTQFALVKTALISSAATSMPSCAHNLRLFTGILRHRVPWIQEADRPAGKGAGKDAVVMRPSE